VLCFRKHKSSFWKWCSKSIGLRWKFRGVVIKVYTSGELLPWQKRFSDEFYKEIIRLHDWPLNVAQIKKAERSRIIGKWTKKYIYSALPKGVLEAMLNITTCYESGSPKKKYFNT
jgi:hypothetical protein